MLTTNDGQKVLTKTHLEHFVLWWANKRPMRAYALLEWFFGHFQSRACMYGEDRIVGSIVFTTCIIAILTISRAIIQSCMGGSGLFAKGPKLSWISNYCISLIEIQSKRMTLSRSQAIVYGRMHGHTDDGHNTMAKALLAFGLFNSFPHSANLQQTTWEKIMKIS